MLAPGWQQIVSTLGTTVRDVRTLLGWSQDQLADLAVVSQGTVSRLERGTCAAIPFHSVVVILRTLAAGAAALDVPLSPIASHLLALSLPSLNGTLLAPDDDFAYIARTLKHIPRRRRPAFLAIVRATVAAFDAGLPDID